MKRSKTRLQDLIKALFQRYKHNLSSNEERGLVKRIYRVLGKHSTGQDFHSPALEQDLWDKIQLGLRARRLKRKRMTVAIAATIIPLMFLGLMLVYQQHHIEPERQPIVSLSQPVATLSFKDGATFHLDASTTPGSSSVKTIASQSIDGARIIRLPELTSPHLSDDVCFAMDNPTKIPYAVILNDGSQIWLNHGASITFENKPSNRVRKVTLSGEAFFDVESQSDALGKIPFVVQTKLQEIEVLGTQFNVNAQGDRQESVELLEGRIKLKHNHSNHETVLLPGQHAFLKDDTQHILVSNTRNSEKVKAWKKGLFLFDNEPINQVIEELAHWYNASVILDKQLKDIHISAIVERYPSIDQVLELIELTNHIQVEQRDGAIHIQRAH